MQCTKSFDYYSNNLLNKFITVLIILTNANVILNPNEHKEIIAKKTKTTVIFKLNELVIKCNDEL